MANIQLAFEKSHNTWAIVDKSDPRSEPFHQAIDFLLQSNWSTGMTINPIISEDNIRAFWNTAESDEVDGVQILRAQVEGETVVINETLIEACLNLNDADASKSYPKSTILHTFIRMGYEGSVSDTQFAKAMVSPNWRYILHVCLHCFSSRKAGWNNLSETLGAAVHGLVTGEGFNMSHIIFQGMLSNLNPSGQAKKFLMYPRFLQVCLNHLFPNMPRGDRILRQSQMNSNTLKGLSKRNVDFSGEVTPFFPMMLQLIGIEVHDQEPENLQAENVEEPALQHNVQEPGNLHVDEAANPNVPVQEEVALVQPDPEVFHDDVHTASESSNKAEASESESGSTSTATLPQLSNAQQPPLKKARLGPSPSTASRQQQELTDKDDDTFHPEAEVHDEDSPSVSLAHEGHLSSIAASRQTPLFDVTDTDVTDTATTAAIEIAAETILMLEMVVADHVAQANVRELTELTASTNTVMMVEKEVEEEDSRDKDVDIVNLQSQNESLNTQVSSLQEEVAALHNHYQFEIEQKNILIHQQDSEIFQLKAQLAALQTQSIQHAINDDAPKKGELVNMGV